MKKLFKISFVMLLALAVLISSTGITLFKMVCAKENKVYVSLEQFKKCCTKETTTCKTKKQCCSFSTHSIAGNQLSYPENKSVLTAVALIQLLFSSNSLIFVAAVHFSKIVSLPPLLSWRSILIPEGKLSI
jgi:hypothetical protein